MNKEKKSILGLFILLVLIFGVPYLWRNYRDNDIKEHSKFAFGKVIKKTGSLKNGSQWHYNFSFNGFTYEGRWPTHKDYNVHMGDYFLVNFSEKNPEHNKILHDYKLKNHRPDLVNKIWDTIPMKIVVSSRK